MNITITERRTMDRAMIGGRKTNLPIKHNTMTTRSILMTLRTMGRGMEAADMQLQTTMSETEVKR